MTLLRTADLECRECEMVTQVRDDETLEKLEADEDCASAYICCSYSISGAICPDTGIRDDCPLPVGHTDCDSMEEAKYLMRNIEEE